MFAGVAPQSPVIPWPASSTPKEKTRRIDKGCVQWRDRERVSAEEARRLDEQASKRSLDRAKSAAWRTVKVLQDKGLDCLLIVQDTKTNTCQVGGTATMVENCLSHKAVLPSSSTVKCSTVNIHQLMNVGRGRRHKRVILPSPQKENASTSFLPVTTVSRDVADREATLSSILLNQDLTPEKALPMQRPSPVKSRKLLALPSLKAENPGRRGRGRGRGAKK